MVGFDLHAVLRLVDLQFCDPPQKLGHHAGMTRIEMRDQNESHADIQRHMGKELLKSLQPAG